MATSRASKARYGSISAHVAHIRTCGTKCVWIKLSLLVFNPMTLACLHYPRMIWPPQLYEEPPIPPWTARSGGDGSTWGLLPLPTLACPHVRPCWCVGDNSREPVRGFGAEALACCPLMHFCGHPSMLSQRRCSLTAPLYPGRSSPFKRAAA